MSLGITVTMASNGAVTAVAKAVFEGGIYPGEGN